MILLIDNYDSFVYNLARYFQLLECQTLVVRNDESTVDEILDREPAAIVISPGPGTPEEAGISLDLVRRCPRELPVLGVCLGHQVIAAAFGARVVRGEPMHGRTSWVHHDGHPLFDGIPSPFLACRYHSLRVAPDSMPEQLIVTAWTEDRTIMALQHPSRPVVGVQFHPESVLTKYGMQLCQNFLKMVERPTAAAGAIS